MLESYKGRTIEVGQEVLVYFNLHKKVFSIKDAETGLVVAHGDNIQIATPEFIVNQKGRERVLKETRKNVHAYVKGAFNGIGQAPTADKGNVYYNPYKVACFVDVETGCNANDKKFTTALLSNKNVFAF